MPHDAYVITPRRRVLSLFVGAGVGGLLTLAGFLFIPDFRASLVTNGMLPLGVIVTWVVFSFAFLIAIIPVALVWRWIERKRRLGWKSAAAWGGILGGLCSTAPFAALLIAFLRKEGLSVSVTAVSVPPNLIIFAVACPVIGVLVGLATWRFAYRRQSAATVSEVFT